MSTVKSSFDRKDLNINTFNFPSYRVSFIKLGKKDPCTYQINSYVLDYEFCLNTGACNRTIYFWCSIGLVLVGKNPITVYLWWLLIDTGSLCARYVATRDGISWSRFITQKIRPNSDRGGQAIVNCGKHPGYGKIVKLSQYDTYLVVNGLWK